MNLTMVSFLGVFRGGFGGVFLLAFFVILLGCFSVCFCVLLSGPRCATSSTWHSGSRASASLQSTLVLVGPIGWPCMYSMRGERVEVRQRGVL